MTDPSELTRQEPEENLIKCPRCQDLIRELVQSPLDSGILICDKCHAKTMLNLAGSPKDRISTMPEPKTYSTREAASMMVRGYKMDTELIVPGPMSWTGIFFADSEEDERLLCNFPDARWTIAAYPKEFDGIEAVRLAKETGRHVKQVNWKFPIHWDQLTQNFVRRDGCFYVWDHTDMEAMWEFYDEPQPPESAKVEQVCGTCRYHHHDHCRISAKDGVTMISRQCVVGQLTKTASTDTCPEWREKAAKQE